MDHCRSDSHVTSTYVKQQYRPLVLYLRWLHNRLGNYNRITGISTPQFPFLPIYYLIQSIFNDLNQIEAIPIQLDQILRGILALSEPVNILLHLPSCRVPWQPSYRQPVRPQLHLVRLRIQARQLVTLEARQTSRQLVERYLAQVYISRDSDHRLSPYATQVGKGLCGSLSCCRSPVFLTPWRLQRVYCACESDGRSFLHLKQEKVRLKARLWSNKYYKEPRGSYQWNLGYHALILGHSLVKMNKKQREKLV